MGKYSLVSADSHVVEPEDAWLNYIAPAFKERVPRLQRDENGQDWFYCDGVRLLSPANMSRAGKPLVGWGKTRDDVYPGAYNPHARLKEMAVDGVDAEVVYPTVSMRIYSVPDVELRRACFAAYNSWAADFSAQVPDRLKAIGMIDMGDVESAIAETQRIRKLGLAGVMIALSAGEGLNSAYANDSLDPLWATIQDLELPASLHIVAGPRPIPVLTHLNETFLSWEVQETLAVMVYGGLFHRFPRLKVVSAENDGGWVIPLLDRMDYLFTKESRRMVHNYFIKDKGMLPSEYCRRNLALTFIFDKGAVEARKWIGAENIMWSSDYPHDASTWPRSRQLLDRLFQDVSAADREKMTVSNAVRLYRFS